VTWGFIAAGLLVGWVTSLIWIFLDARQLRRFGLPGAVEFWLLVAIFFWPLAFPVYLLVRLSSAEDRRQGAAAPAAEGTRPFRQDERRARLQERRIAAAVLAAGFLGVFVGLGYLGFREIRASREMLSAKEAEKEAQAQARRREELETLKTRAEAQLTLDLARVKADHEATAAQGARERTEAEKERQREQWKFELETRAKASAAAFEKEDRRIKREWAEREAQLAAQAKERDAAAERQRADMAAQAREADAKRAADERAAIEDRRKAAQLALADRDAAKTALEKAKIAVAILKTQLESKQRRLPALAANPQARAVCESEVSALQVRIADAASPLPALERAFASAEQAAAVLAPPTEAPTPPSPRPARIFRLADGSRVEAVMALQTDGTWLLKDAAGRLIQAPAATTREER
jgi:phage-related minor tail protein